MILGIDYGAKHIGIARALDSLAEPLQTLPNTTQTHAQLLALCSINAIKTVIIGEPDKQLAAPVALLSQTLVAAGITVYIVDETLSSHDARLALLHTSQKRRKTKEHEVAAAIILQSWLDANPKNQ